MVERTTIGGQASQPQDTHKALLLWNWSLSYQSPATHLTGRCHSAHYKSITDAETDRERQRERDVGAEAAESRHTTSRR